MTPHFNNGNRRIIFAGLIPASVAITTHGNYTDAWVRDNVYSILAVFGLSLAYKRLDDNQGSRGFAVRPRPEQRQ